MIFRSVLTVCVGNVCRSPVAEAFLRHLCPNLHVGSAGFSAPEGRSASSHMVNFAAEDGIDLSLHRASRLSKANADRYDLILVMEDTHLKEIAVRLPHLRARSMLMTQWIGGHDLADPIDEDLAFNKKIYDEIKLSAGAWAQKLGGSHG